MGYAWRAASWLKAEKPHYDGNRTATDSRRLKLSKEQLQQKLAEFPEKKRGTGKRVAVSQETPAEDGDNE